MNAYKVLYKDQLTEKPIKIKAKKTGRSKSLGWVFFTNNTWHKPKSVRTYHSLHIATKQYRYFTPNTFYHSESREQSTLRWINAISVDFDVKDNVNNRVTLPELLERINAAGLPLPTQIVKTPSGGFHIHWYLKEARRCDRKNRIINHYKRVLALLIEEIGADSKANGPERYFRVPNSEDSPVVYQTTNYVDFDEFCNWYSIELDRRNQEKLKCVIKPGFNLFSHPALLKLLEGVEKGKRDNTCYTLALAYKSIGLSMEEAEQKLHKWNLKNMPALSFVQVHKKVKSAYKNGAPLGPSARYISELSGTPFSYQVWEPKKDRSERKYSHYDEWEEDVLSYLRQRNGKVSGSQRLIADQITSTVNKNRKIPFSTFKVVLKRLIDSNKVVKLVEGKGRNAITTLYLQVEITKENEAPMQPEDYQNEDSVVNVLNSYTPIAEVAGGDSSPLLGDLYSSDIPSVFSQVFIASDLSNYDYRSTAWRLVTNEFDSLALSYKGVLSDKSYLRLVCSSLDIAIHIKGKYLKESIASGLFYNYFIGTFRGLLFNYRQNKIDSFVVSLEKWSIKDLYKKRGELKKNLAISCTDSAILQSYIDELDLEIMIRLRQANFKYGHSPLVGFKAFLDSD